jgi:hypothetical protein
MYPAGHAHEAARLPSALVAHEILTLPPPGAAHVTAAADAEFAKAKDVPAAMVNTRNFFIAISKRNALCEPRSDHMRRRVQCAKAQEMAEIRAFGGRSAIG